MAGATIATAPSRSIIFAVSAAIRLSNATTRRPRKVGGFLDGLGFRFHGDGRSQSILSEPLSPKCAVCACALHPHAGLLAILIDDSLAVRSSLSPSQRLSRAHPRSRMKPSHEHAAPSSTAAPEQLYAGLGNVHHPVTTKSKLAQKYFDQGLAFDYGFNHAEAYQSFAAAAALDPNTGDGELGHRAGARPQLQPARQRRAMKIAYGAIHRAQSLKGFASPEEKALIDALAKRYGADGKQTPEREQAYADAMREVAHQVSERSRRAGAVRRVADGFASVGAMDVPTANPVRKPSSWSRRWSAR